MKLTLSVLLAICTIKICHAQKFDVKYGPASEITKSNPGITAIVGSDEKGFYAIKFGGGHGYLEKVSKTGQSIYTKEIFMPNTEYENTRLLSIVYFNDHFVIFTSNFDKDKKSDDLFANNMDVNGTVDKESHLLAHKMVKKEYAAGNFNYEFSNDTSKILVIQNEDADDKDKIRKTLTVYNFDFKEVWKKTFDLPFTYNEIESGTWDVDNDGTVYYLVKKAGEHSTKEPDNDYALIKFEEGSMRKPRNISLGEGKFIHDTRFGIDDKGSIILSGFYAKSRKTGIIGTFYVRFNGKTDEEEVNVAPEFSPAFLATIFKAKHVEKEKGLEGYYHMNEFKVEDDESLFILAQNSYYVSSNNGTAVYYQNIIATKLSPDGKILWQVSVPMNQVSGAKNDDFLGYFVFRMGEKYAIIYNDDPDNIDTYHQDDMKYFKAAAFYGRRADVMAAIITPDGKMKKQRLFDNEVADKYWVYPSRCQKISDGEALLYMERSDNYRFAKLDVE